MKHLVLGSLVSLAMVGCSDSGGSVDIATTPLAGKVFGQSWTFGGGVTDGFLSKGDPNFFADLYSMAYSKCDHSGEPTGPHVILAIPRTVGQHDLSLSLNMTFVNGSDNKIGTSGKIAVDTVDATHVTGGIHAKFDADNEINGMFDVTICPETGVDAPQ